MKNKLQRKQVMLIAAIILAVMVLVAGISILIAKLGSKNPTSGGKKDPVSVEEQSKTIQLLGFESYEEMVGTKILVENELGSIKPNKDKAYITQGEGSMRLEINGDYGKPDLHPYMQLDCIQTTIATADFSQFEKITFDVYNDTDEEIDIMMSITANDISDTACVVSEQTFTLTPNAWTTCSYMMDAERFVIGYYDLTQTRYITFTFLEHKTSKDDVRDVMYIDNLIGHYLGDERALGEHEFNFYEGITFENIQDQRLLKEAIGENTRCELSRISYAEEGIQVSERFGQYGMRMTSKAGIKWPTVTVYFGEILPAGTIITFDYYVDADVPEGYFYQVQSNTSMWKNKNSEFKRWNQTSILLNEAAKSCTFFFNFDQSILGLGLKSGYSLGEQDAVMYLDNIKATQGEPLVSVQNGVITLSNQVGARNLTYKLQRSFKKGQVVSFDVDFTTEEGVSLIVLENGKWGEGEHKYIYQRWFGKRNIAFVMSDDAEYLEFRISYNGQGDLSKCKCMISNIQEGNLNADVYKGLTFEKGFEQVLIVEGGASKDSFGYPTKASYKEKGVKTVSGLGSYGIELTAQAGAMYPDFHIQYPSKVKEGKVVTFMAYVEADNVENKTYRIESFNLATETTKKVVHTVSKNFPFNEWFEVTVKLNGDTSEQKIFFNFETMIVDEATGEKKRISIFDDRDINIYVDNIKVSDPVPESVTKDGVTTINNLDADEKMAYTINKSLKKGQVLTLDVDFNMDVALNMSFKSGKVILQNYMESGWSGKKSIAIMAKEDVSSIDFAVNFTETGAHLKQLECTLSNIAVGIPKYNYYDGLSFESGIEHAMIQSEVSNENSLTLSRVMYSSKGMTASAELGAYGLHADVYKVHGAYPRFTMNYGETIPAGTTLKFMAYVQVENPGDLSYRIEAQTPATETTKAVAHTVSSTYLYNNWYEVSVTLKEDTREHIMFFNFFDKYVTNEKGQKKETSIFGDKDVDIYLDDFKLVPDYFAGVSFESAAEAHVVTSGASRVSLDNAGVTASQYGDYAMKVGSDHAFNISYVETLPAGASVSFMAYVDGKGANYTVTSAGHQVSAPNGYKANEWCEIRMTLTEDTKIQNIVFDVTGDATVYVDYFKFVIDYYNRITFDNEMEARFFKAVKHLDSLLRVKYEAAQATTEVGDYGLKLDVKKGPANGTYPTFKVNYTTAIPAGTVLGFKAYVEVEDPQDATFRVESYVPATETTARIVHEVTATYLYNNWFDVRVKLNAAVSEQDIFFNFSKMVTGEDNKKTEVNIFGEQDVAVYLDNFELLNDRIVAEDSSITFYNKDGNDNISYQVACPMTKGQVLTFDLDFNTTEGMEMIVYQKKADGTTVHQSRFAESDWSGKKSVAVLAKDNIDSLMFAIRYLGTENLSERVTTITNMAVGTPEYDYYQGLGFETGIEHGMVQTGKLWNVSKQTNALTPARVAYANESILMPTDSKLLANLGAYGIRTDVYNGGVYPEFTLNYGAVIPKGTQLKFKVYVKVDEPGSETFRMESMVPATPETPKVSHAISADYKLNEWFEVIITLNADMDQQLIFFNFDKGGEVSKFGDKDVTIYFDSFKLLPEPDFKKGITFENEAETISLATQAAGKSASLEVATYPDAIKSKSNLVGENGLKMVTGTSKWPEFKLNYGSANAGTVLSFLVYVDTTATGTYRIEGKDVNNANYSKATKRFTPENDGLDWTNNSTYGQTANSGFELNQWYEVSYKLATDVTAGQSLFFNIESIAGALNGNATIWVDNIQLSGAPSFYDGVTFEKASEAPTLITRTRTSGFHIKNVPAKGTYPTNVATQNVGTKGIKLDVTNGKCYPKFDINYGTTIKKGSVLTFDAYVAVDTTGLENVTYRAESKDVATHTMGANIDYKLNGWYQISITLNEDVSKQTIFFNFDKGGDVSKFGNKDITIYLDNFKITE